MEYYIPFPRKIQVLSKTFFGRGGRGGPPTAPALAGRRQLSGRPVVHPIVRLRAQRKQVPVCVGILRKLLDWPDVVDDRGLAPDAVAQRLLAQIPGSAERTSPAFLPPLALVVESAFAWHGMHLRDPGIQKAGANDHAPCVSLAPALIALALLYIDHMFSLTIPAEDDHALRAGLRRDPHKPPVAAAGRADQPPVSYCQQFTTIAL